MEQHEQPRFMQRRVATAPTLLQPLPKTSHSVDRSAREVDTIFYHDNAKVISLVALSDQTFSLESSNRDTIGPWQSHFERTIAIGSLRLYRAPGSVAFLSCGSALQPIFPKSQCWCMEEDGSKFILQIRPPSYWRIELASRSSTAPVDGGADSSLRACLESVLLLDKTPCPFKESVPISLPTESPSVKKRRPWKPLRSYPSEPILPRNSGQECGDSPAVPEESERERIIKENQYELDREVAQGHGNDHVRLSKAKAIPEISQNAPKHCGALAERSKEEIVATDEAAGIADERSSSTACMHTMLRKNEQLSHPLVTAAPVSMQANSPAPVATAQVTKAKQTVTHLQTDQGTVLGTSNTVIVEKREMRRRHTVDSGWHDRELEEIAQTTSSFRHDDSTRLEGVADKLSEDEVVMPDSMMAAETPSSASDQLSNARHPAAASQQAQKLRLRRKGLFDRKTYQRIETERKAAYPDGGPGASGMLSKTIILLFYALFGIVVLAFTTAGTAASSWWKPNPQSRHNTDAHRDTSTIADQMLKDHDATDLDDDDS